MAGTDWRHDTLNRIRLLIQETDPDVSEEAKWVKPSNPAGIPTWSRHGFMQGATPGDPDRLFNAGRAAARQGR